MRKLIALTTFHTAEGVSSHELSIHCCKWGTTNYTRPSSKLGQPTTRRYFRSQGQITNRKHRRLVGGFYRRHPTFDGRSRLLHKVEHVRVRRCKQAGKFQITTETIKRWYLPNWWDQFLSEEATLQKYSSLLEQTLISIRCRITLGE